MAYRTEVACEGDLPGVHGHVADDVSCSDGQKILVSQSTSGDVPESGLDVLNQDGDSIEVALARQLVAA